MNLLREYIRELLTESIDPGIMSQIDKAEKLGIKMELHVGGKYGSVTVYDKRDYPPTDGQEIIIGAVDWETPGGGKCNGAEMVSASGMSHGLGPLLYDVAIEASQGLMADRGEVSSEAEAVWQRYMAGRPDVEVIQLDDPMDTLTPGGYDNCDQEVAGGFSDGWNEDIETPKDPNWMDSPLSKMYRKSGTPVIDELRKRGILKLHGYTKVGQ